MERILRTVKTSNKATSAYFINLSIYSQLAFWFTKNNDTHKQLSSAPT